MFNKTISAGLVMSLAFIIPSQAQQLSPQTISSAGQSQTTGNILLESSVGGFAVADLSTAAFMYTAGFLQPDKGTTTTIPVVNDVVLNSGAGIDLAGASLKAGNAMIDFTVGEFVSITHQNGSNMLTQGILQPYQQQSILPVTGLSFTARRTTASLVHLTWKTVQEANNAGFYIERKNANENNFRSIRFMPSKAAGGNSYIPLEYATNDTNTYNGKSWYRILQQDADGRQSYSVIRLVESNTGQMATLKAFPVPAISHFTVVAEGIEQDQLLVFDMNGKLVQQRKIKDGIGQTFHQLPPGTYFIRLAGQKELVVKAVVQ